MKYLVTGSTGSGKTTTVYSILNDLLNSDKNIMTIEDPVEIRIDGLNQIEIGNKSTFSGALRTVLRQDPDMILLGEIRDQETAEIAIQAGQTGHYVLSTIHTIDAIEVINRMRKMGLSDYDISSTLATSVSQRLVRRICPECRREREYTNQEKEIMTKIAEKYGKTIDFTGKKTYDAVGCKKCNNIGYYGRIGVFEILDITDEIKELIVKGASTIEIRKKALEQNLKPILFINKIDKKDARPEAVVLASVLSSTSSAVGPTNMLLSTVGITSTPRVLGEGTEEISFYTGPKVGGFLNATFGNATELIISFFALKQGLFEVVKSSISGAIIGNILLVLGASMLIGGVKHKHQKFNKNIVEVSSSMLLFAVIGLCIPAVFTHTFNNSLLNTKYEGLSLAVAVIMFILYIVT